MIPSLQSAFDDRRLGWHERVAFGWLVLRGVLDVQAYRPLKAVTLQVGVGCRKRTAQNILIRLTETGYLQCGEADLSAPAEARQSRPRWYRLAYAVPSGRPVVPPCPTEHRAA
jgi:hypothetical protein